MWRVFQFKLIKGTKSLFPMELPHDRQIYTHPIEVSSHDIDELNHVNNVVYVQWIQDAAAAHWNSRTDEKTRSSNGWVVLRHEIDYKDAARLESQVVAYTWVGETAGPKSVRHVIICDAVTKKIMVEAKTTWCLIDPVTQKPKRITQQLDDLIKVVKR